MKKIQLFMLLWMLVTITMVCSCDLPLSVSLKDLEDKDFDSVIVASHLSNPYYFERNGYIYIHEGHGMAITGESVRRIVREELIKANIVHTDTVCKITEKPSNKIKVVHDTIYIQTH